MTRRQPPLNCCAGCHRLTAREVQVLCRVAAGRTSKLIAEELGISLRNGQHTSRAPGRRSLASQWVAQLTRYVIEHKIEEDASGRLTARERA